MRRRCSEEEKTILKKHRKAIVKGVVKGNSFMLIPFLVLGVAIGAGAGALVSFLLTGLIGAGEMLSNIVSEVITELSSLAVAALVMFIGLKLGRSIVSARLLGMDFEINAVVITKKKAEWLYYIEADSDIDGVYPEYTIPCEEMSKIEVGDKLLLVIRRDGGHFLMKPEGGIATIVSRFVLPATDSECRYVGYHKLDDLESEPIPLNEAKKTDILDRNKNCSDKRLTVLHICLTLIVVCINALILGFAGDSFSSDAGLLIFIACQIAATIICSGVILVLLRRLFSSRLKSIGMYRYAIFIGFENSLTLVPNMRILVRTAHGTETRLIKDPMYKSRDRKRFLYGEIVEFCEGSKGCLVAAENGL